MDKQDLVDFLSNLMDLKHYGTPYFSERIEMRIWKGDTTVEKMICVELKANDGVPKNSNYFKKINRIFGKFDIDYDLADEKMTFRMNVAYDIA